MYFFDTYALWELLKGNPAYFDLSKHQIICTIFNAYEFYNTLRREFNEATAQRHTQLLKGCIVDVSLENIYDAVEMKKKNSKLDLSFIDCLGYVKARELGFMFLTGDRAFEKMPNVEFRA